MYYLPEDSYSSVFHTSGNAESTLQEFSFSQLYFPALSAFLLQSEIPGSIPYFLLLLRYHKFPDGMVHCTEKAHNHPAYKTASAYRIQISENTGLHSLSAQNNLFVLSVHTVCCIPVSVHPYIGWHKYNGSSMPSILLMFHMDKIHRNTYLKIHISFQNPQNTVQIALHCM